MSAAFREGSFTTLNSTGAGRIVYSEWGPPDGRVLICVHGLTGNGRDFDYIAPALAADGYRVIAPDMPGRGRSDFCTNPQDYTHAQYVRDIQALFAHLDITAARSVDWLGVSMGGLIGLHLASAPDTPIARMILNDIGPVVPQDALNFISLVLSQTYRFATMAEFETRLRATRGLSWGPVTDDQWAYMAQTSVRRLPDGILTYAYDPAIRDAFATNPVGAADLWAHWDALDIKVLTLRGENSVLLTPAILDDMGRRGPGAKSLLDVEIIAGAGHVPSLMAPDQIDLIRQWLGASPAPA